MKSCLIDQLPPNMGDCTSRGFPREVGKAYARVRDRWYGKYRIRRHGTPGSGGAHGRVNRWRVENREDPPARAAGGNPDAGMAGAVTRPRETVVRGGAEVPSTDPDDSEGSEGSEGSANHSLAVDVPPNPVSARTGHHQAPVRDTASVQRHPSHPPDPPTKVDLNSSDDAVQRARAVELIASTLSVTGLRVDLPLTRQRLAETDRHKSVLHRQLIRDHGFPAETATGRPASRPWASAKGKRRLRQLAIGSTWPMTADGQPAIDQASLSAVIAGPDDEELRSLAALIDGLQSRTTFLDEVSQQAQGGRVHPTYATNTATGRWTSARPNVLAAGRRTRMLLAQRDVVLAEHGHVFIGVDLAGVDARCVAGLSGDLAYAELATVADPHSEMAKLFFGTSEHRSAAKAITHGINYGRGARSIARQTNRSVDEVESLLRQYIQAYPEVGSWQEAVRATAVANGRVATGTGRVVAVDPAKAHTTAPARVAQAAARDLAVVGLMRIVAAGLLPNLRLFLHDEVILSVTRADAEYLLGVVAGLMSFTGFPRPVSSSRSTPNRILASVPDGRTSIRQRRRSTTGAVEGQRARVAPASAP